VADLQGRGVQFRSLTDLLQLRPGFRRKSFGDGPRIASERQS
jgi:hypothetical protein